LDRLGTLSTADYSITLPGAQLNALLTDSRTKILQRPQIRASDAQKATLRIGDRVPIATGSFQPGVGGTVVSPLVQTQFQYLDVGVNVDITPKVHANNEITLKVVVEVSAVTAEKNIGGITQPVIGQRKVEHDIRLREGEINVLGGILQTQSTKSVSGVPGLSQIPFLKYLFSNVSDSIAEDEVLIVMRPYTVRRPDLNALNLKALDVGTEGDVHLRTPSTIPEPGAAPETAPGPEAAPAQPRQPGGARLRFETPNLVQQPGETFQVALQIEGARDASSVPLEVFYDPGALKLVRISSGSFLGKDGQPVAVVERPDEPVGQAAVTLSRPPSAGGVSGDGTLAVLTFQAAQSGTTTLGILPSGTRDPSQQLLPAEGAQATVTIR
jgi:general secretion pathway protein D